MTASPAVPEVPGDEHFVDHVVESTHAVQASQDILAANGMKLLAKGAKVDAATRERLLAHKLAKPLEQCLEIAGAVSGDALEQAALKLFEEQPLLRSLYGRKKPQTVAAALARLPLTAQMRTLLTLYADLPWGTLEHLVAVSLLAQGLAKRIAPDDAAQERTLLTAGLLHDVGELYVDPKVLRGGRLDPAQWRHIVAHPLIGHRVLRDLEGAGRMVADAVLQHHERHDGFGYPHRLAGKSLPVRGEVLAAAEWVAGLMRSGRSPLTAASAATRLMPGGFNPSIIEALSSSTGSNASPDAATARSGDALAGLLRIAQTIGNFRSARPWIEGLIDGGTPVSAVLAANHDRMKRIERSFISSGLAGEEPLVLFERLKSFGDDSLLHELESIVREIGWRLRELERDTLLRASALASPDALVVYEMVARLKPHDDDDD